MDYISYVEEVLEKYRKYTKLITNDEITPSVINEALGNYTYVQMGLIAEYNRKKYMLYEAKKKYDYWYSGKFSVERKKMISEFQNKTIKIAQKEIEHELKTHNEDEMKSLEDSVYMAEEEVSYLSRLLGAWDNFSKILISLSNNMRSEMISLSLSDRVNKPTNKVRRVLEGE